MTEGLGPRKNEITRWTYYQSGGQKRLWVTIVYVNPNNEYELIYETGPMEGGHWGHDASAGNQLVSDFLFSLTAPSWACATPKVNQIISTFLKNRTPTLEQDLIKFLSSTKNCSVYKNWTFYEKLTSLSSLGKFGDEFYYKGLLVGGNKKDDRVILFEDATCSNRRIIVGLPFGDKVLATFTTLSECRLPNCDHKNSYFCIELAS